MKPENRNIGKAYGFDDPTQVKLNRSRWGLKKSLSLILALSLIIGVWFFLDQKLLFGEAWLSDTYDNPDWRTNEGNLHTYGAWDLETHIWKTEYIAENFPHFNWNPYWYLGMPLLKYYQAGFYFLNIGFMYLFGLSAARSALLLIIFGHLLATLLTFLVCYKVSGKIFVSSLASTFVLSNTFLSLRSYGWEPITVVFLFLYPLGLYLFLKEPLRPFRFWLILVLGLSYLSHPLIWFSLCMFMGLYLLSIAVRRDAYPEAQSRHYIWSFIGIVILSLFLGALQFLPQMTYEQVTSGAHMGVKYLPFYQVGPNIISPLAFFFDAGNLKGPGPVIMIAVFLLVVFALRQYVWKDPLRRVSKKLHEHELISGVTLVLFVMVLFYYLELYNIFPMNLLRSIQYHRIIPEFVITASVLLAALSTMAYTYRQKVIYYSMLIAFFSVSMIIIYFVQAEWVTSAEISSRPEFIYDEVPGRISMPYTDQSFAVRNSFTLLPQVYGYYEQGITNPYTDELFSVSSGYHNALLTMTYLKAANVGRLYVNLEEGERDAIVMRRLEGAAPFVRDDNIRYGYFDIDLKDPSPVQVVDQAQADSVKRLEPGCREMFRETYCGSVGEEFVSTDPDEYIYLTTYVGLTETPYDGDTSAEFLMLDPDHYLIKVRDATAGSAFIVKMTYDKGFEATVDGVEATISTIGPGFMLISPEREGTYDVLLTYHIGGVTFAGLAISIITLAALSSFFLFSGLKKGDRSAGRSTQEGDMA